MLTGTSSTDDGMIASYAWVETSNTTNTPITLDDNTSSTPSFTVASTSTAGEIVFTLTVTDDGVATTNLQPLSDTATVTIVVSDTTDPVFTELSPDVTIAAGPVTLSTVVLAFNSNEAGPVAMLVLPAGDDAPSADTIKEASGDGSIKGTAVAGQMQSLTAAGLNSNTSYSAHAVVTDLAGNDSEVASSASFKTLNAAPIANAGATQPVLANASVQLNGSGTDVDSDDMTLTYLWTQTSGTTVTLSSTSIANPTFDASVAADAGETLVFNLVVTDSDGLASVAASTSVVVAPVPLAVPDLQTPTSAAFVYVTGASIAISFANDGGKILTECVAVPALPTGLIIAPTADNASCTITGTAPATAVAIMPHTITASNAAGADATPVAITITINEAVNADPTITIATATNTVAPGAAVTLSGGCADSDGSIASCVWTYTSGGTAPALTPGTSGPATTATFIAANTGNTNITLVFTLTATDDEGATATATASVTITPVAEGTLVLDSVPGPIRIQVNVAIDTPIDFIISQGDPSGDATCSLTSNLLGSGLRVDFVATPQPLCRLSGTGSSAGSAGTITVQVMDGDRTSNAVMVRAGVSIASTVQNLTLTMYVGAVYRTDNANINSLRFSRFISEFDTTHTCTLPDDENLPRGLRLEVVSANTQCAIIGTPLEVTAEQTYSVTLNNGFGSSVSTLTLTVSNSVAPQFALPSEVTSLEAEQAITTPIQLVNTSVAANPEAAILKNCIQVNSANPDTARTIATSNGLTVNRNCTLTGTPTNPVETTIYIRATGMNRISGISAIVVPITTPGGNTGPTVTAVTATSDAPTTTTVTLTSSAAGQAYILVVADALDTLNMPTPTAIRTMVKAATEGATVETVDVTADMATTAKIGGLVANTLYKVYVATEDAQDIISQSAPSATFTTTVDLLVTPIEILHFRVVNQSIDPIDIAFTGTPTTPIACTSDNLPMGLEIAPLNGNSCQITGTPTIAALTEIEFRVTDASSPAAVGTGTVMILVSESLDGNTLGASSIVTKLSYRENEMRRESNGDLTGDSVISISSRFTSSTRNVVTCTAVDKPLPAGLETEATSFGKNCYIYGRALKATPLDTYTILVKSNLGSATVVISLEVLPAKLATLELPAMVPEIRLNKEIASTDSIKLVNTNTESGLNDVSCQLVTSNSVDASPVATGGQDGWQASGAGALCGIFGTPTKLGLNTLYVLIENKDGAKSVSTIEITTTAPVLTVDAPTEIQTVGFEQPIDPIILQVSGNPTTPVTCTATGIPAGLEIKPTTDTESCEIVGTPTALGDSTVAFTITDATIPASTVSGMVKIQVGNLPSTTEAITLSVRADESLGVRDVSDTSKNVPNIKLFFFTNGTVDPFFNPKTNACNFVTSEASPAGIMLETSSSGDSCYIYGTPTVALSQRTYTIVASNQYGDTLVDISIEVLPASTGGISGATGASAAQPPSANAGADQTVANAGGIVVIDASTSSAGDSEIAQYAWSQTSGTRVALYGTNTALASFNPADTGLNGDKLSFTVTITSSTGQAATDEVVVNVLPARPSLNSPTYTHIVSAGEPMAPIVLTNTGGGRLLAQAGCTANNLPKGLSISLSKDGHTCQIKGTPPTAQDNPISISIRATNATGTATSAAEVSLLVQ
ncbi:MAG: putative Ig domain-containing protein [Gammaproteobacteria bacterium]|nr:putative Ig domain-containing protein [Gammaproteobacteria bacterium]